MTDKAKIRLHLAILAAYSLLFCFVIFPFSLVQFDKERLHPSLMVEEGAIASLPSIAFWIIARWLMLKGAVRPQSVHIHYAVICILPTYFWFNFVLLQIYHYQVSR